MGDSMLLPCFYFDWFDFRGAEVMGFHLRDYASHLLTNEFLMA